MKLTLTLFVLLLFSASKVTLLHAAEIHADLTIPPLTSDGPGPGKRFLEAAPEYTGTEIRHQIFLPADWTPDWERKKMSWPVIVEYTGNYFPPSGSTGQVFDGALGYGLSGGKYIWVVLPFISKDRRKSEVTWWGDAPATVDYAKKQVPRICSSYGGNQSKVVLCGFSRGAIAVNYIGLYDDEIAKLWCGLISHDHYDGVSQWPGQPWATPFTTYRTQAVERLRRLQGRPVLISQANSSNTPTQQQLGTYWTKAYLLSTTPSIPIDGFTFLNVPIGILFPVIPNSLFIASHTDRWMFIDSPQRRIAWKWLEDTFARVPLILLDPVGSAMISGQSKTLTAKLWGNGSPSFQWQRELPSGVYEDLTGQTSSSLFIPSLVTSTPVNQKYQVQVRNGDNILTQSITLTVNPGYQEWARQKGLAAIASNQDPDKDGLNNLMEYATGSDPNRNDRSKDPIVSVEKVDSNDYMVMCYYRNKSASDVTHKVQVSTNLKNWTDIIDPLIQISNEGDGTELVIERDSQPLASGTGSKFMRLLITK